MLAIGGDLSPERLIAAYSHGIFPWFSIGDPLLWWSPSERAVIQPDTFSPSKSLKKFVRKQGYRVSVNTAFEQVIEHCALIRGENSVWITEEMRQAYIRLHQLGAAHSIEVWQDGALIGGLYGVSVGSLFCGESMFSLKANASKTALWYFCHHFARHGGKLIDCQMMTEHLASLGAAPLAREAFIERLTLHKQQITSPSLYRSQWIEIHHD